jgi:hypothetical protein
MEPKMLTDAKNTLSKMKWSERVWLRKDTKNFLISLISKK